MSEYQFQLLFDSNIEAKENRLGVSVPNNRINLFFSNKKPEQFYYDCS